MASVCGRWPVLGISCFDRSPPVPYRQRGHRLATGGRADGVADSRKASHSTIAFVNRVRLIRSSVGLCGHLALMVHLSFVQPQCHIDKGVTVQMTGGRAHGRG
ncbi:hypothetical protein AAG570_004876 [Ranatra chinensis]|uniref:Uncharacterized protein n=1 Tax=Ranatra chinensis TaxID=642074 RepID=A0ABD0XYT4_9HEMI